MGISCKVSTVVHVQCTSNNSLHVKYAFRNSCISKMGHRWFRCGLSPLPLQAIIYRLTLMYCQLGPWEQISVKFQTNRISIHETEFEKVVIKMVAILSQPQHVDQILLLFDNRTQYRDIELNKWQKCAWFSIAHFLITYGTQDVNKGRKVLHACESQGLTLRIFYQNHCIYFEVNLLNFYLISSMYGYFLVPHPSTLLFL